MSDQKKDPRVELFKELMNGTAIPGSCTVCGHLNGCVCALKKEHKDGCLFKRAALLSVELGCPHGYQACPECDPCSCGITVVGIR